jgi:hypothetical protein
MIDMKIISCNEAKARGLKRYFTGEPCPSGHIAERYCCGGTCVVCTFLRNRENRKLHRERLNKLQRQYTRRNIEFIRTVAREKARQKVIALRILQELGYKL